MDANSSLLWAKIEQFQFDQPQTKLTFAKRLARENGFSESFAKDVILEYKKFIFLCCVSERPVTPSNYVDMAWHLHLTYTKSYWLDFCRDTLGKDIHHNPTEGGVAEGEKFRNYYQYTLEQYQHHFGTAAPVAIWENTKERFTARFVSVNQSDYWLIPKWRFNPSMSAAAIAILCVFCAFAFAGCEQTNFNWLMLGGGGFLVVAYLIKRGRAVENNNRNSTTSNTNNNNSGDSSSYVGDSGTGGSSFSRDGSNSNRPDSSDIDTDSTDSTSTDGSSDGGGDSGCSGCGGGCGGD